MTAWNDRARRFAKIAAIVCVAEATACKRSTPPEGDGVQTTTSPSAASSTATTPDAAPAPIDPCRVAGTRAPMLARFTTAERTALDETMRTGIAVMAANDCRGLRLLPACHARGRYGYLGVIPKTRGVDLSNDEQLRINAPLGQPSVVVDAGVHALHIDVTIIGQRATTRALLTSAELTGDCADATHFVEYAQIGRSVIAPATSPSFGTAGDPCRAARRDDDAPPAGCAFPVEIRILPIAELGSLVSFDHAPDGVILPIGTCPNGMVVSKSRCVRPPADAPYLCAFGDAAECREQCDRGDVNSCDVLGFMLWHGKGVPKDVGGAAALYVKACQREDAIACGNLGAFLYDGEVLVRDQAKAATLFERACSLGDTGACGNVALAYLNGAGVHADARRGASLLLRACDVGSAHACVELAKRLLAGGDGGTDAARARGMLDDLCDVNDGEACAQLARLVYVGKGATTDHAAAAPLFEKACRAGASDGCIMLGLMYRQADGVRRDDALATRLMTEACARGAQEGCFNLGIAYENGKGIAPDPARAAQLYERACAAKVARACFFLADAVSAGVGVTKDPAGARELYARACELGEKEACGKAP